MDKFYTYDNAEDIKKCLNCTKAECNNCLGNFYSAGENPAEQDDERED